MNVNHFSLAMKFVYLSEHETYINVAQIVYIDTACEDCFSILLPNDERIDVENPKDLDMLRKLLAELS